MTDLELAAPAGSRLPRIRPDVWTIGAALLAGIVCLPVASIAWQALAPSGQIWGHLASTVLPGYAANSLALMVLVACGVVLIGTGTAWLVAMCRFPGRRLFEWALLLPLACPAYVVAIVYVELLEYAGPVQGSLRAVFGWSHPSDYWFPEIRSLGGAATMLTLVLYPYVYLLARTAFLDTSVSAMEVARTLGHGPWRCFAHITLPLARPAIVIGLALAMMEVLADFGTVQIFAVDTFTTGIYEVWLGFNNIGAAAQLAGLLLVFVVALISLEWASRRGRRFDNAGRHYRSLPAFRLNGLRAAGAIAACLLPTSFGFILPIAILARWAFQTAGNIETGTFFSDLTNTLGLAAITALIAIIAAVFLSYAMRLRRSRPLIAATRIAASGYAIPGPVIAVGVLIPFALLDNTVDAAMRAGFGISTGLLLSGTLVALVFAYLVRFLALSLGSVEASLMRVTGNMDGAARTLGHGPWSTLRRIHLPLIRGGLLTAGLLVFVDVMKELPATLILRPFNFSTLATRIFEFASEELFEETGLWALSIVLAGVLPVIVLTYSIGRTRPGTEAN
jgi:iron(III) transport system permease protein